MALTKVSRGLLSTGIVDNSNATAITLNADESATFAGAVNAAALTLDSTTSSNAGITIRMGTANSGANDSFIGFQNSNGTEVFRTRYDNPTTSYAISSDTSGDILTLQRAGDVSVGGITGSASGTLKVKSNSNHLALALEEHSGNEAYQLGVVANGSLVFTNSGSSEVMRLTDADDMYFGSSSGDQANVGHIMQANGVMFHTAAGSSPLRLRRNTSNGGLIDFNTAGTTVGSIDSRISLGIAINSQGADGLLNFAGSECYGWSNLYFYPRVDNSKDLGLSVLRWDDIFATNGTINTSDRNEKQDIELLSEAEMRVAKAAKGLLRKYRWKSSVAEKGDDARIHVGVIAQDLEACFTAEGLDAARYAMFCSDTWTNDDGSEQTRLGVRYPQLLAFIISAI